MSDNPKFDDGEGARHETARRLAEQGLAAQAAGDDDEAERLFTEAERVDPDAMIAVLQENAADANQLDTGADSAPADDQEIAAMSRTIQPGAAAPSRAGISGRGSGADGEGE